MKFTPRSLKYQNWINAKHTIRSSPLILSLFILVGCGGDGSGLDANGQPLSNDNVVSENDPFAPVQAIFNSRCVECHNSVNTSGGLNLEPSVSFDNLVNIASSQQPDLNRIEPNNANNSYLVRKVRGSQDGAIISGGQMPLGGPPLTAGQIASIESWVNDGALPSIPIAAQAEFIAELSDMANYMSWDEVDYSIGNTNEFLAGIHQGNDDTFSRRVFSNPLASNLGADGEYPNGAILVKEVKTISSGNDEFAADGGLLAMVKRGGDFNTENNGWEWFALSSDMSEILARGANVMENGCNSCHAAAEFQEGGADYVFLHPSEKIAEAVDFSGYQDWAVIDDRTDRNVLLGQAHGVTIDGSIRRVYQKQFYANPISEYPIGTILVKDVIVDGEIIETTGMVKRGGNFANSGGDWEWFVLESVTGEIALDDSGDARRGALLNNGGCVGCHTGASRTTGEGIDFVFKHPGAPVNNNSEFFAELADFEEYLSWDEVDYSIGDTNEFLLGIHQGNDDTFSRRVFSNPTAMLADGGVYPNGSILVKEVKTISSGTDEFAQAGGLLAMVKRGGSFNPDNNGWEWFVFATDLSAIVDRGVGVMENGCNNCHASADLQEGGGDYVFLHPSEKVAEAADFANFRDWTLVDERDDRNPLLGQAHQISVEGSVRRVYQKQLFANPNPEYPIGTILVKEITSGDEVLEVTAMVKRGGNISNQGGDWEWFFIDDSTGEIALDDNGEPRRGPNLNNGGCVGCHSVADSQPDEGIDFVFKHPNAPVNTDDN